MTPRLPRPQQDGPAAMRLVLTLAGTLLLAACQSGHPDAASGGDARAETAQRADTGFQGPDADAPRVDGCLASAMLAEAGGDAEGARTQEHRFAVPCPDQMTGDFTASLQRALIVRGYHEGAATGVMDEETAQAIRRFQRPRGLDSDILSLDAARALGLVVMDRSAL